MTKEEWVNRCVAQYLKCSNLHPDTAREFAESSWEDAIITEHENDPEGAAEEEMLCWED